MSSQSQQGGPPGEQPDKNKDSNVEDESQRDSTTGVQTRAMTRASGTEPSSDIGIPRIAIEYQPKAAPKVLAAPPSYAAPLGVPTAQHPGTADASPGAAGGEAELQAALAALDFEAAVTTAFTGRSETTAATLRSADARLATGTQTDIGLRDVLTGDPRLLEEYEGAEARIATMQTELSASTRRSIEIVNSSRSKLEAWKANAASELATAQRNFSDSSKVHERLRAAESEISALRKSEAELAALRIQDRTEIEGVLSELNEMRDRASTARDGDLPDFPDDDASIGTVDKELLLQLIKGADVKALAPLPDLSVNSVPKALLLFSDWVEQNSSAVAAAFPNADLGEEIWEAEFEHACKEHLRYANAGSTGRAQFIFKSKTWTGVRKALGTRLYALAKEAISSDLRTDIHQLKTTFKDTRGKWIATLGGVFFMVLKSVYSGRGEHKTAVLEAIQSPAVPKAAHEVSRGIQAWRRSLVMLQRLGVKLPDLTTLVPVLKKLYTPAAEVDNTLSWAIENARSQDDVLNETDSPLTPERLFEHIDVVVGLLDDASPQKGQHRTRAARAAAERYQDVSTRRDAALKKLSSKYKGTFSANPSGGMQILNATAALCTHFERGRCSRGYNCSFKHVPSTSQCTWCGNTGHKQNACELRKEHEGSAPKPAPKKQGAPKAHATQEEKQDSEEPKPKPKAKAQSKRSKIDSLEERLTALQNSLAGTVEVALQKSLATALQSPDASAKPTRVVSAMHTAPLASANRWGWDTAAERVFRPDSDILPSDRSSSVRNLVISRAGDDTFTGREFVDSGEVEIPGEPLLPATRAVEEAHYSYVHTPGALGGQRAVAKLSASQISRINAIIAETEGHVMRPELDGHVPYFGDADASKIREDLRKAHRMNTSAALTAAVGPALANSSEPSKTFGDLLRARAKSSVNVKLASEKPPPSYAIFGLPVALYDDAARSDEALHSKVASFVHLHRELYRPHYLLALWGLTSDLKEFYSMLNTVHSGNLSTGSVDCISLLDNSTIAAVEPANTLDNGACQFFELSPEKTGEMPATDAQFDVPWTSALKVVSKVPKEKQKVALDMLQELLQRRRRGVVDLQVLGAELRRRLSDATQTPLPDALSFEVELTHDHLPEPYDPTCTSCLETMKVAGDMGVVASEYDGRIEEGELVLLFDFAVNWPVGPQGERNLGCSGILGKKTLCLTPTNSRDENDMLTCLSDARITLRLRDCRVVVRADRETSLVRSFEVQKQLRAWDWRSWSSIPGAPDTNPAELYIVKRAKNDIAHTMHRCSAPPDLWPDCARTVQTNVNFKAGHTPIISTLPPLIFGRACRGLLAPGALTGVFGKVQSGQPRWRPMASLGPDLTCSGGVRVAVYDAFKKRHLTTVKERDLQHMDDVKFAWQRKVVPLGQPSPPLPVPELSNIDLTMDADTEVPLQCEACDAIHMVTVDQRDTFATLQRDHGISFECTMLGKAHDLGVDSSATDNADGGLFDAWPTTRTAAEWCDADDRKLLQLLRESVGLPDLPLLRRWWPQVPIATFKRKVRETQAALRTSIPDPAPNANWVRVLRTKVVEATLFEPNSNLSDDARVALAKLSNVDRDVLAKAARVYTANGKSKAFAVVVSPRDALLDKSQKIVAEWKGAIDTELQALLDNKVVALVPISEVKAGDELIPSLAVLTVKGDGRKKCRLVACGNFQSVQGSDVFASVAGHVSWVTLLAILIPLGIQLALLDVTTAFLQTDKSLGGTSKRTFLRLPSAFKYYMPSLVASGASVATVLLVLSSVYGLATAPKAWKKTLVAFLISLGFRVLIYDDSILVRDSPFAVIILYVDDLMVLAFIGLGELLSAIRARFKTTEPRYLKNATESDPLVFLAHEFFIDYVNCAFVMHMESYAESALATLVEKGVITQAELDTPLTTLRAADFDRERLAAGGPLSSAQLTHLRSGIGGLGFTVYALRWDLLAPLGITSQGQSEAKGTVAHLDALKLLLRYFKSNSRRLVWPIGPVSSMLGTFPPDFQVNIEGEFDANLPFDKARQGMFLRVNVEKVTPPLTTAGRTSQQPTLSTSTCEAELTSGSWCAKEVIGTSNFVEEVFPFARVVRLMYGDNDAANLLANGQASLRRMRHLCLAQLYVRSCTESGRLVVRSRRSNELAADMATKVLAEQKLATLLPLAHLSAKL